MAKRILVTTSSFDIAHNPELCELREQGFEIVGNRLGRRLSEDEAAELVADRSVVAMIAGVEPLTRRVLEAAPSLQIIARCGIGMDNVDLDAACDRRIIVSNTPGAPAAAVAELTVALTLDVLRRVSEADRRIRGGQWKQLMGRLLAAQTVGIVGYGRIGKKVAQIVQAFGARVIVYDKHPVSLEANVTFVPMNEILAGSDVIALHLPYDQSTHHMIGRDEFAVMKPGTIVINTSRGGVIDEEALCEALRDGKLAGAGLDVFENEPYSGCLSEFAQVVLTAHMGSYAKEARIQMERNASGNLLKGLEEKGLLHKK